MTSVWFLSVLLATVILAGAIIAVEVRRAVAASLIAEISECIKGLERHTPETTRARWSVVYRTLGPLVCLLGMHPAQEVASFYAGLAWLPREAAKSHNQAGTDLVQEIVEQGLEAITCLRMIISRKSRHGAGRA